MISPCNLLLSSNSFPKYISRIELGLEGRTSQSMHSKSVIIRLYREADLDGIVECPPSRHSFHMSSFSV